MKKITLLLFTFLISSFGFSQTTFAIYTEDANIGEGIGGIRFSNGQGFSAPGGAAEATTAPFEGSKNYLLTYNNTNSYLHAIFIATNGTGGDITADFSPYSYYNIALKTVSESPFFIRIRGNNITAKVRIDPALAPAAVYNFDNDGSWHFLSIPLSAFVPDSGTFNLNSVSEVFVLRSDAASTLVDGIVDNFEFDNIYLSTTQVLSVDNLEKDGVSLYPNPTENNFNIKTINAIDNLSVFNVLGQKVFTVSPETNSYNVDISAFKTGIYLVKVTSEGKELTTKLIKK